jgi:hypothetical protein
VLAVREWSVAGRRCPDQHKNSPGDDDRGH